MHRPICARVFHVVQLAPRSQRRTHRNGTPADESENLGFLTLGRRFPAAPPNLAGNQSESAIAGPLPIALLESLSPPAANGGGRGEGYDA